MIWYMNQFSSVTQSCLTLCDPMNCSTPGLLVHHQFPKFTQTHVHWFGDAIQPSHPLSSPSPPVLNLSQHQGLFKWVSSLYQVAKVLEFQLQHQSYQFTLWKNNPHPVYWESGFDSLNWTITSEVLNGESRLCPSPFSILRDLK